MKALILSTALFAANMSFFSTSAIADEYVIDTEGAHASIQFRVKHLGYSWLYGRFNTFEGTFNYQAIAPEESSIQVTIDTNSVDSNHAERDKHLRGDKFLDVKNFPEAKFVSTKYTPNAEDGKSGLLQGDLTLHGVTKPLEIAVTFTGEGNDPWGGYRAGFEGTTSFTMADFGLVKNLGPKSKDVEMILAIEGKRK